MKTLDTYTSTGYKLIHHPDVLRKLKYFRMAAPVSLQIAPTSQCNLNCIFCSNVNRTEHESINSTELVDFLSALRFIGLKSVEWTGGGDPTMYLHINELISLCSTLGLRQGMITNGVALDRNVKKECLDKLDWVRISMNCLDYVKDIQVPSIKGTLGFSYVYNALTTDTTLSRLDEYVHRFHPSYVRIVPNCQSSDEEQERNNVILSEMVSEMGPPYFYQEKVFRKPSACYWCYLKPFLLHDGYVYPCSSVVLNSDAGRKFHEKYRWCKMSKLVLKYSETVEPFDSSSCHHCVFAPQNDMICDILDLKGMECFI